MDMKIDIGFVMQPTVIEITDEDGRCSFHRMERWPMIDQVNFIEHLCKSHDLQFDDIEMDRSGVGLPVWMELKDRI